MVDRQQTTKPARTRKEVGVVTPYVAIDDGHSHVKAIMSEPGAPLRRVTFESSARAGASALMGLSGDSSGSDVYLTEGHRYTVASRQLIQTGLDTRTTDFPLSEFNRVLVAHALHVLGLPSGGEVVIATGLPLREWIAPNRDERLAAKMRNIATPVTSIDGWERPAIAVQHVLPEAISAYMHAVEQGVVQPDSSVAIVDIGGRTMDVAVVMNVNGTPMIDRERSGSDEIGALGVRDRLRALMVQRFALDQVADGMIDQALATRSVKLFNRDTDASDMVDTACQDVRTSAANAARRRIGQGADLAAVLLVGGGSHLLDLSQEWPHAKRMAAPEFANAEGMLVRLLSTVPRGE